MQLIQISPCRGRVTMARSDKMPPLAEAAFFWIHDCENPICTQPDGLPSRGRRPYGAFLLPAGTRPDGVFILRIEDTDLERSTPESVQAILDGMEWLGLDYDEGPFYQTQRFDRYAEVVQQLLDEGKAYHCYCSKERIERIREEQMKAGLKPRYDGHCRRARTGAGVKPVVRFRNPAAGDVVFDDLVRGRISISNTELDDLVIARPDGSPTYNFTVVVDDMDMEVSLVIRGDDHINNTPRQINIYQALGPNCRISPMCR